MGMVAEATLLIELVTNPARLYLMFILKLYSAPSFGYIVGISVHYECMLHLYCCPCLASQALYSIHRLLALPNSSHSGCNVATDHLWL